MRFKRVQWLGLLALLLSVKFLYYYHSMEVETNYWAVWAVSVCLSYLMIVSIERAALNRWLGLFIYFFIAALVVVDVVYYRYFYQYFTLNLIAQAYQIPSVSGSFKVLLKPADALLLMDIPFMIGYWKALEPRRFDRHLAAILAIKVAAAFALLLICLLNPWKNDVLVSLRNEEFITYHLKDLIQVTINASDIKVSAEEFDIDDLKRPVDNSHAQYFGLAKDRNVILVQVESLQQMLIEASYEDQEITPNLNRLIDEDTIYFKHYYQQLGRGNTSDAEFTTLNSLLPAIHGQSYSLYENNHFFGLPLILRELGYSAVAYHGFQPDFWNRSGIYPQLGFENFYSQDSYTSTDPVGFGINDKEFLTQAVELMKQQRQPTFSFLITLSSHTPFELPEHLKTLPVKNPGMWDDYIQSVHYTDASIGLLIDALKKEGLYDNSIIIFYGDHFGLNKKDEDVRRDVEDFLGRPYDYDEMMNIPLIIHIPHSGVTLQPEITGGQIDLLPTLLNLLGLDGNRYFFLGQDMLNAKDGLVISQTYLTKGSFIDDQRVFEMSRDGIFAYSRAWGRDTGIPEAIEPLKEKCSTVTEVIDKSNYVLQNDLIDDWIDMYHHSDKSQEQ